jgi:hypothetical protein
MQVSREAINMLECVVYSQEEQLVPSQFSILGELVDAGFVRIHEDGDYNSKAFVTAAGVEYLKKPMKN